MSTPKAPFTIALAAIFIVFAVMAVLAYPTMLLWNHALVPAFNGTINQIDFFQTIGIMILAKILFKGYDANGLKQD